MGNDVKLVQELKEKVDNAFQEIAKVIIGQKETTEKLMISLFSGGHSLLVGVPGLAKTLLIKSFTEVFDLKFNRIQFTPDLMPSDITGTEILESNKETGEKIFRFIEGPIFANVILADEINRTPPKTQAALLEAMQEKQVTISEKTLKISEPFLVLATQNPIEQEGTYPLPEAQLDRFMFNLWMDYPTSEDEFEIVKRTTVPQKVQLEKVFSKDDIFKFRELLLKVPVADNLIEKAVKIVGLSRKSNNNEYPFSRLIEWGAGPRASQFLILAAKGKAILDGRFTPNYDDIRDVAIPVLRHRIVPSFNAEAEGIQSTEIINQILKVI